MSTIKLCMSCSHCVKLPDGQGMRCRKFKMVETSIARYDGYDICGKKGKYFELPNEFHINQTEFQQKPGLSPEINSFTLKAVETFPISYN